ncbi:hypothetical protein ANCCEY_08905 [Ancylostoma ceylanicum]|uniref:Uncharacterized protein n=2 Tax=Ancylostoma ceylanicum TaxID=53326 RepID=A0A0D6LLE6_9BILA|nr:hypothetical protein ANCCEY_08905 [Ancylostoma ceylanicum]EYC41534.1 hypothetical protein Y032_0565g1 [Ancylostoma ceylanicum]
MTDIQRPDGTVSSSRWVTENNIHFFYSDPFKSHTQLPLYLSSEDRYVVPSVLPSEVRYAMIIQSEHLRNLPPIPSSTLRRLFAQFLLKCKILVQWKTSRTVPAVPRLQTLRVILNEIERTLDDEHINAVTTLIEASRECEMSLGLGLGA